MSVAVPAQWENWIQPIISEDYHPNDFRRLVRLLTYTLVGCSSSKRPKFEMRFLGALGRPENWRPAEKKIHDRIFRGIPKTGWLEVCTKIQWMKILNPIFRGPRKTGEPETGRLKDPQTFFWYFSENRRITYDQRTNRPGCILYHILISIAPF